MRRWTGLRCGCSDKGFSLTDPDHFPALHDRLYERHGTDLATGCGSEPADRARADRLASPALGVALWNGILATTDEELEIVRPLALLRSWEPRVVGAGTISALVGDHVRLYRWVGSRGFP